MNEGEEKIMLFVKLQEMLRKFDFQKRKIILAAIIVRVYHFLFTFVLLSVFIGYMRVLPIYEMEFITAIKIFRIFFVFVIFLVVFSFSKSQLKKWYLFKNPQLIKNKKKMNIYVLIITVFLIYLAYYSGSQFITTGLSVKELLIRFAGTISVVLILILPILWLTNLELKFYRTYKIKVIPEILTSSGINATYYSDKTVNRQDFIQSKLFDVHIIHRFQGGDLIEGKIDDIKFSMSYLKVFDKQIKKTSDGTSTVIKEIFNGIFFVSNFNKNFKGECYIFPDVSREFLGSVIGEMTNEKIKRRGKNLVKLEDPEFEKEFAVYSSDQIEARTILTPAFMERINELRIQFFDSLKISFIENKIYIAILSDRNLFDPTVFKKLDSPVVFNNYAKQIQSLISISKELKLHVRLWDA